MDAILRHLKRRAAGLYPVGHLHCLELLGDGGGVFGRQIGEQVAVLDVRAEGRSGEHSD